MKRDKLEIAYSVGVIIAIPLLLALNTVLLVRSTRSAFNSELRRKADLVNAVIAESSVGEIKENDTAALDAKLQQLEASQPAIRQTAVITDIDGELTIIASGTELTERQLNPSSELQAQIAFERRQPVAKLVNISNDGQAAQAWNVVTPVIADDEVIAVISSSIVTSDAEEAIDKAFTASFVVMIASILVILALLFRHFRLVGYIQLLAKQRELNQTMSDFLSVATHELKAPTSIIKGYLSNVLDGTFGPVNDKVTEQLETAIAQTERLNSLVQDLLNVSRIEQGRIEYKAEPVDVKSTLQLITTTYQPIAAKKGLELHAQLADEPMIITADSGRIQEICTNLVDNAVKYTAAGSVTVTAQVTAGKVVISIRDTGFGMSPEARKRLFQRFYRIKTEQTKDISGTGLGLWIIKKYIEAMKGTIEVESLEGAGSNFIVTFPLA